MRMILKKVCRNEWSGDDGSDWTVYGMEIGDRSVGGNQACGGLGAAAWDGGVLSFWVGYWFRLIDASLCGVPADSRISAEF
jgi:hypothetical protein